MNDMEDIQEQVADPVRMIEVEVGVKKLRNRETASKDKSNGEIVQRGNKLVIDWICKLCNMACESDVVPEVCCNCSIIKG